MCGWSDARFFSMPPAEPEPNTALPRKETLKEKLEDAEDLKVGVELANDGVDRDCCSESVI